jgi:long-chain acyl-CoA synthetase
MQNITQYLPATDFPAGQDIPSLIQNHAKNYPGVPAFILGDRVQYWPEFATNVRRVTHGLKSLGVKPGDRIAQMSRNSIQYAELFCSTLSLGACTVPLATMINAASLKLMLEDSNAKVLVVEQEYRDIAVEATKNSTRLLPGGKIGFDFSDQYWQGFDDVFYQQPDEKLDYILSGDEDFNIIYSSGTTGVPKGILHSHRTRCATYTSIQALGFDCHSINLVATPMHSNTTITTWIPTVAVGGTNVLMEKFSARGALELIEKHKITNAMLVPVQYDRMLREPGFENYKLSSVAWKYCTSAPLRAVVKKQLVEKFPGELVEFYSLTEGGVTTLNFVNHFPDKFDSVGPALDGCVIKIIDDQGNELPVGTTGEIVGRSKSMSSGYVSRGEANIDMHWYDQEGLLYYRSGDVGRVDEDGFLYLLDRKKDMIISGGVNIYASDLEIVLLKHPSVHEVAVISVPSQDWGETPLALVVLEKFAECDEQQLCDWANQQLGKSQRISAVEFLNELPKSQIGKILKKELRAPYWEDASN